MDETGAILFLLISIAIYFVPTIIAAIRGAEAFLGIFLLDLLLGWTLIGWVGALVWSVTSKNKKQKMEEAMMMARFNASFNQEERRAISPGDQL